MRTLRNELNLSIGTGKKALWGYWLIKVRKSISFVKANSSGKRISLWTKWVAQNEWFRLIYLLSISVLLKKSFRDREIKLGTTSISVANHFCCVFYLYLFIVLIKTWEQFQWIVKCNKKQGLFPACYGPLAYTVFFSFKFH